VMATAINTWVRDEFLERDDRLRAGLAVSTLDIPTAVAEIERWDGDGRFAQILMPVRNDVPYGNRLYHPLYAAAHERGLPIALHAWGRSGNAPTTTGVTTTYLEDYASNAHIAQTQMMSLVAEGVFSEFPELKIVFLECGFSWLPPQLWRFDKDWKGVWREVPWVKERPSEYVRRHMRFTTEPAQLPQDPEQIAQVVEMVGPELLLYASDHPHEHGDSSERLLASLSEEDAEAILRGNAAAFYGGSIA
jgi:predicted TIM-barrel fold metal-dependent hydrolase